MKHQQTPFEDTFVTMQFTATAALCISFVILRLIAALPQAPVNTASVRPAEHLQNALLQGQRMEIKPRARPSNEDDDYHSEQEEDEEAEAEEELEAALSSINGAGSALSAYDGQNDDDEESEDYEGEEDDADAENAREGRKRRMRRELARRFLGINI